MTTVQEWRFIKDGPGEGPVNMATDEAMLLCGASCTGFTPTLRIYGWSRPTITIGRLQDAAPFTGAGPLVIRRITGGRALLHDREVTYSIVAPSTGPFSGGIGAAYAAISECIARALRAFGIDASFVRERPARSYRKDPFCFNTFSRYEISVGGRKIAAGAQRRMKGLFLQHGSIVLDVNRILAGKIFGEEVLTRSASVREFSDVDGEEFIEVLVERMATGLGASFSPGRLTGPEEELRDLLIRERYGRPEWNLGPVSEPCPENPGVAF